MWSVTVSQPKTGFIIDAFQKSLAKRRKMTSPLDKSCQHFKFREHFYTIDFSNAFSLINYHVL
jgi:hypothetical protein